jgi:integrase
VEALFWNLEEKKRERFLNSEELQRLGGSLRVEEEFAPFAVACIRLLLLTGCRLGEIQTIKWCYLDLDSCLAFLPDSKTGRKTLLNRPGIAGGRFI